MFPHRSGRPCGRPVAERASDGDDPLRRPRPSFQPRFSDHPPVTAPPHSDSLDVCLVALHALPAIQPASGRPVGGTETRAWMLARGLAARQVRLAQLAATRLHAREFNALCDHCGNKAEVLSSLREGKSGIVYSPEYAELSFRSHVCGSIKIDIDARLDRKLRRFMGDGAAFNYFAMQEAVEDAGLSEKEVSNERTGLIMGSGGTSTKDMTNAYQIAKDKGPKVDPELVRQIESLRLARIELQRQAELTTHQANGCVRRQ